MKISWRYWGLIVALLLGGFTVKASPTMSDVDAFIMQYDKTHRQATHTPGWVFAYAKQGELLMATFGEKAIGTNKWVTEESVFRIASVSKIFVGIAVQQLLEQEKVQLDTNIETYLPAFSAVKQLQWPVTLRQLMSHTAGFEDKFYGDSTRTRDQIQSLAAHLNHALPKQIYPPGKLLAYSNYGYSLAALVVEKVMNMPFHRYVQQYILAPAGMNNSGFMLSEALQAELVMGYQFDDGEYHQQPYTWVHRYPSTSMLTTAADMAKLIAVLTSDGQGEYGAVLSSASLQQMFSTLFSQDPELPGMALGWMELQRHGHQLYFHDGGTPGFVAELVIMPEHNAGYFIAANQKGSRLPGRLRFDFLNAFYANDDKDKPEAQYQQPVLSLVEYAGRYQNNRKNVGSFEAFAQLMARESVVATADDGKALQFWGRSYHPYGEHRFIHYESGHRLVFKAQGHRVTQLFLDWGGAPRSLAKLEYWQTSQFRLGSLGGILALNLLALILCWRYRQVSPTNRYQMPANGIMLLFFVSLALVSMQLEPVSIRFAEMTFFKVLLVMPILAAIMTGLSLLKHGIMIRKNLALLPVLMGLAWLVQFNLLGWHFY